MFLVIRSVHIITANRFVQHKSFFTTQHPLRINHFTQNNKSNRTNPPLPAPMKLQSHSPPTEQRLKKKNTSTASNFPRDRVTHYPYNPPRLQKVVTRRRKNYCYAHAYARGYFCALENLARLSRAARGKENSRARAGRVARENEDPREARDRPLSSLAIRRRPRAACITARLLRGLRCERGGGGIFFPDRLFARARENRGRARAHARARRSNELLWISGGLALWVFLRGNGVYSAGKGVTASN